MSIHVASRGRGDGGGADVGRMVVKVVSGRAHRGCIADHSLENKPLKAILSAL